MGTPLESPALVYLAASNFEAQLIASELMNSGIPAYVVEDHVFEGTSFQRWEDELKVSRNSPEIYVGKCQLEEARVFLLNYVKRHKKSKMALFCFHCGASFIMTERENDRCPECDCDLTWSDEDSLKIDPENQPRDVVTSLLAIVFFIVVLVIILFR